MLTVDIERIGRGNFVVAIGAQDSEARLIVDLALGMIRLHVVIADRRMEHHARTQDERLEVKTTTCYMCACRCGIRVHLREGEVRYIDGNPEHPLNQGVICAKGASGITGAGFITLAATLTAVNPGLVPGMAIVFAIDKFMSECRALTNICGNGVATFVVAAWEGELDRKKLDDAMHGRLATLTAPASAET